MSLGGRTCERPDDIGFAERGRRVGQHEGAPGEFARTVGFDEIIRVFVDAHPATARLEPLLLAPAADAFGRLRPAGEQRVERGVPAGGALAVDREGFAAMVTEKIRNHPNITVIAEEVTQVPEGPVIIATGPLTSDSLSEAIGQYFGQDYLHFFDAAAPLVTAESVDMDKAWWQSRYDRGTPDYVNCAMNKEEYEAFIRELVSAEEAPVHGFEDKNVFEGCMPVEVMARRGFDTLRYGPLKPVGLTNPKTGKEPYAVVQLRQDNAAKSVFNLVGFQTHLKFPEQKQYCITILLFILVNLILGVASQPIISLIAEGLLHFS